MKSRLKRSIAVCLVAVAIVVAACGGSSRAPAAGGCTPRQAVVHAAPQISARYAEFCTSAPAVAMVAGPDSALWFVEGGRAPNNALDKVGRITTAGTLREYRIPLADGPGSAITSGPDGALWFTGYTGQIGRITTSGAFSVHAAQPFPGSGLSTLDIILGPDGALWFTVSGGYIGRITASDAPPTLYLCGPCGGRGSTSIAGGPDRAVWFVVYGEIRRVTAAGSFDQRAKAGWHPNPMPGDVWAQRITMGPDDALWFTETASKIGRIATSGAVTEFPIPAEEELVGGNKYPTNIIAGPDGALWFTETGHKIGRITTSGVVTEYPISALPTSAIAAGPDGAIWFAEYGNKIGRLSVT